MGNLAVSYDYIGRHKDALDLKEKVLVLQKKMLGEDNPDTLRTMGNITSSYWNIGRHKDGLELNQVVLEMQTRVLGIEHPDTLRTSWNLLLDFEYFGMTDRLRELPPSDLTLHTRNVSEPIIS